MSFITKCDKVCSSSSRWKWISWKLEEKTRIAGYSFRCRSLKMNVKVMRILWWISHCLSLSGVIIQILISTIKYDCQKVLFRITGNPTNLPNLLSGLTTDPTHIVALTWHTPSIQQSHNVNFNTLHLDALECLMCGSKRYVYISERYNSTSACTQCIRDYVLSLIL